MIQEFKCNKAHMFAVTEALLKTDVEGDRRRIRERERAREIGRNRRYI
jgi:hypothetical protein